MKHRRKVHLKTNLWNQSTDNDAMDKPFYQTKSVSRKRREPNKFIKQLQQQTKRFKSIYTLDNGITVFIKQNRGMSYEV